jgi:hypothetical protein
MVAPRGPNGVQILQRGSNFGRPRPTARMKRQHRSGELYIKWSSYYGRFRTPDGRRVNRRIGSARRRGSSDGLTKSQAEAALRRLIEAESNRTPVTADARPRTVDEVIDLLRDRLALQGAAVVQAELRVDAARTRLGGARRPRPEAPKLLVGR